MYLILSGMGVATRAKLSRELVQFLLLIREFIFVYSKLRSMTQPTNTMILAATIHFSVVDGVRILDEETTVLSFLEAAKERLNREDGNEKDILAVLNKYNAERLPSDDVISRVIRRREDAENAKRLLEADEGTPVQRFEFSPAESKALQANLEASIANLSELGVLNAKPGKGGGIQTVANIAKLPVKSKAKLDWKS